MKKIAKFLILPLFIIGALTVVVTFDGCKKANPMISCSGGIDDGCGNEWETCCSSVQCYYTYKGKKYNCDGDDCTAAAEKLAADIMSCSSIDVNSLVLSDKVSELIEVVQMIKESNMPCEE